MLIKRSRSALCKLAGDDRDIGCVHVNAGGDKKSKEAKSLTQLVEQPIPQQRPTKNESYNFLPANSELCRIPLG